MNKHSVTVEVTLSRRNLETIKTALEVLMDSVNKNKGDESKKENHLILCEQALDRIKVGLGNAISKERLEK